nr:unnamed protein product [Callosobruchus chinensis]
MQQMQEDQMNQVGGGMGLNLGLGLNGGMFNRNSQMRNRMMGLAVAEPRKPGCHGRGPRPPPPTAAPTPAGPTNASVNPRDGRTLPLGYALVDGSDGPEPTICSPGCDKLNVKDGQFFNHIDRDFFGIVCSHKKK